jgi:hypothetical protein
MSAIPLAVLSARPRIHLAVPPPGRYGIEDLWKATVYSDTECFAWFEGYVFEASHGQVFWAKTDSFLLRKNTTRVYGYHDVRVVKTQTAPGYEVFVTRNGTLPQGEYDFVLLLKPLDVGDTSNTAVRPMGPPRLILPKMGDTIKTKLVQVVWTPPSPRPPGLVTYTLKLCQILPPQTPEEALAANPPWFEQKGLQRTSLSYPLSARPLPDTGTFAWQVTTHDQNGGSAVSDARTFGIVHSVGADTAVIACPVLERAAAMYRDTAAPSDSGLSETDAEGLAVRALQELVRRMESSNEAELTIDIPPAGGGTGTGTIGRSPGSWSNWHASGTLVLPSGTTLTFSKTQEQKGSRCEREKKTGEVKHPGHPEDDYRYEYECEWAGDKVEVKGTVTRNCHAKFTVEGSFTLYNTRRGKLPAGTMVFRVFEGRVNSEGKHEYTYVGRITLYLDCFYNGWCEDFDGVKYQVKGGQLIPGEKPFKGPRPPGLR